MLGLQSTAQATMNIRLPSDGLTTSNASKLLSGIQIKKAASQAARFLVHGAIHALIGEVLAWVGFVDCTIRLGKAAMMGVLNALPSFHCF